jgi:hypothetical protein
VLYCSKRCQKTAWQHPAVPHRAVCETLRQFCAVYELARNPRPTPNEPSNPPLDEDTANWILDHFRAQSQYELEHSRMSVFFRSAYIGLTAAQLYTNLRQSGMP